jgi:hypothetical protein
MQCNIKWVLHTKQPPAKAGGFELRTESPDTRRLNDARCADFMIISPLPLVGEGQGERELMLRSCSYED